MPSSVTGRVEKSIDAGKMHAMTLEHAEFSPGHILAAMLVDPESLASRILAAQQDAGEEQVLLLRNALDTLNGYTPKAETPEEPVEATSTKEALSTAEELRRENGDLQLSVDDLLLALFRSANVKEVLGEAGFHLGAIEAYVCQRRGNRRVVDNIGDENFDALSRQGNELVSAVVKEKKAKNHRQRPRANKVFPPGMTLEHLPCCIRNEEMYQELHRSREELARWRDVEQTTRSRMEKREVASGKKEVTEEEPDLLRDELASPEEDHNTRRSNLSIQEEVALELHRMDIEIESKVQESQLLKDALREAQQQLNRLREQKAQQQKDIDVAKTTWEVQREAMEAELSEYRGRLQALPRFFDEFRLLCEPSIRLKGLFGLDAAIEEMPENSNNNNIEAATLWIRSLSSLLQELLNRLGCALANNRTGPPAAATVPESPSATVRSSAEPEAELPPQNSPPLGPTVPTSVTYTPLKAGPGATTAAPVSATTAAPVSATTAAPPTTPKPTSVEWTPVVSASPHRDIVSTTSAVPPVPGGGLPARDASGNCTVPQAVVGGFPARDALSTSAFVPAVKGGMPTRDPLSTSTVVPRMAAPPAASSIRPQTGGQPHQPPTPMTTGPSIAASPNAVAGYGSPAPSATHPGHRAGLPTPTREIRK